jgi:hypothetical protein
LSVEEKKTGQASGWTVDEDPEGGFRWAAHGVAGTLRGHAKTRAEAERAAQKAEQELSTEGGVRSLSEQP